MSKKSYPVDRAKKYPFADLNVNDAVTLPEIFNARKDAIRARCAAHMIGFTKGRKFRVKIRETDAGKFELTAQRVA